MGFFSALARPFTAVWRAFKGVFKSEMAKFVAKYELIFRQAVIQVAEGQLEGDSNKRNEAFSLIVKALAGVPGKFKDHWVNWGLETVLAKLKQEGRV